ncbi:hypothetical protein TRFO_26337 [Tritrichomonas foetus]|uniref:Uncharacterized protein n=1 Tax=Tritrichomonas foetus TaxID=1144522 RepID=A0A1J4K814_9EUKA|nr:hypothetical protein TRFO_26337 [Tritrichomonas foetus]|eukprot:OHT05830.1 hypothetical protein TRFO_26337 [Tritrichomonas foetus]
MNDLPYKTESSITANKVNSLSIFFENQEESLFPLVSLIRDLKSHFENEDFQSMINILIKIIEFLKQNTISISDQIFVDFTYFLIFTINQILPLEHNKLIFYLLFALNNVFYQSHHSLEIAANEGQLQLFINLIDYPVQEICNVAIFIVSLFYSSRDLIIFCNQTNSYHVLCKTFEIYLINKPTFQLVHVISTAFNNIIKNYDISPPESLQTIIKLYSLTIPKIDIIIDSFLELIQILKDSKNEQFYEYLFQYEIVDMFWSMILAISNNNYNHVVQKAFYFFYVITFVFNSPFMERLYTIFNNDIFFDAFLNLSYLEINNSDHNSDRDFEKDTKISIDSNGKTVSNKYIKFGIQIIENLAILDPIFTEKYILSDTFINLLKVYFQKGSFEIKYEASHCLFTTLRDSTTKITRKFFSSDILIIALDILDCDIPDFIVGILEIVHYAMRKINEFGTDDYQFYRQFENMFFQKIEELESNNDDKVQHMIMETSYMKGLHSGPHPKGLGPTMTTFRNQ